MAKIIPTYNYAQYLPEAIESALKQTVAPLQIIVVDDGSTDNTQEVLKNLQFPAPLPCPLESYRKENGGLSAARNTGILAAKGEYILCLDADDTLDEHFLEFTEGIDDIVATKQQEFGQRSNVLDWKEHPVFKDFMPYNQIPAGCLFKREIWEKVGGYDESMRKGYEDWDFWYRAVRMGYTVTAVPYKLFNYRIHGDSMINTTKLYHDELVDYILKKC